MSDALSLISADAPLVVAIKSLATTSDKVANLHEAVQTQIPELADLKAQWAQRTGFTDGVDLDSPMVVALLGDGDAANPAPAMLLLSVSGYAQFVATTGQDQTGPIAHLTTPDGRTPAAREIASFALITRSPEEARAYRQPGADASWWSRLDDRERQCIDDSEIVLLVNVPRCAETARLVVAWLIDRLQDGNASLEEDVTGPVFHVIRAIATQAANQVLEEASRVVIGLDADTNAGTATAVITFANDSELGARFDLPNDGLDGNLLDHLPEGATLWSLTIDPHAMPWSEMRGAVAGQFAARQFGMPDVLHTAMGQRWKQLKRIAVSIYARGSGGALPGSDLRVVRLEQAEASGAALTAFRTGLSSLDGQSILSGGQPVTLSSRFTENALMIRKVSVDRFALQFDRPVETAAHNAAARSILAATAAAGRRGYVATIDAATLAFTDTTDTRFINAVVEAAKSDHQPEQNHAWQTLRQLAPADRPQMELLLSAPMISALTGHDRAAGRGRPTAIANNETSATVPPMAIWASTGPRQLTLRLAAPIDLLMHLSDAESSQEGSPAGFRRPFGPPVR